MKFLRRISTGSMSSSSAAMSRMRSSIAAASGRPAPRYAAIGVVFVSDGLPVELDLRDEVDVVRHHLREERQERADAGVRTGVADRPHAEPGDRAVALQPELDVVHLPAAVPSRPCSRSGSRSTSRGRPSRRAACDGDEVLDGTPALAPNAPPTCGATTRTSLLGRCPSSRELVAARAVRHLGATCGHEPAGRSSDLHEPAGSIGTGATRWFTMRARTTTSASSSTFAAVGVRPPVGDVRTLLLELHGGAVARARLHVGDRRQRVVVDDHELGRVDGLRLASRRRPPPRCRRRSAPCRRPGAAGHTRCSGRRRCSPAAARARAT